LDSLFMSSRGVVTLKFIRSFCSYCPLLRADLEFNVDPGWLEGGLVALVWIYNWAGRMPTGVRAGSEPSVAPGVFSVAKVGIFGFD
jgi:hypothetical protein